jgi:hypothetical protein
MVRCKEKGRIRVGFDNRQSKLLLILLRLSLDVRQGSSAKLYVVGVGAQYFEPSTVTVKGKSTDQRSAIHRPGLLVVLPGLQGS